MEQHMLGDKMQMETQETGTKTNRLEPQRIYGTIEIAGEEAQIELNDIIDVAAGYEFSAVLRKDRNSMGNSDIMDMDNQAPETQQKAQDLKK